MKIENTIKTGNTILGDVATPPVRPGQGSPETTAAANPGNGIQLSRELQDIAKKLSHGEVFDAARVAEIKQAISEGRFAVNPEKVADGLLETVRDLIRNKQAD